MSAVGVAERVLSVRAVTKRWDASSGLEPVTFTIDRGQLAVVKGRSGSGKSTLLAILAGWCDADGGDIARFGPWSEGGAWRRWSHTSVVPQVLANVPELSVQENIESPLRLAGVARDEVRRRVAAVSAKLDLDEQLDRPPGEISVGQQQRLAVARAVVIEPTFVLADEPTSHQDADHAAAVMDVLRIEANRGAAVLIASHDVFVVAAADVVIDLDT